MQHQHAKLHAAIISVCENWSGSQPDISASAQLPAARPNTRPAAGSVVYSETKTEQSVATVKAEPSTALHALDSAADLSKQPSRPSSSKLQPFLSAAVSKTSSHPSTAKLLKMNSEPSLTSNSVRWRLHEMLKGQLGIAVGFLILMSTTLTFVELQVYGSKTVPLPGTTRAPSERVFFFEFCMHAFTVLFLIELLLRLYIYRMDFFRSFFNMMDFAIVVLACVDTWVLSNMADSVNIAFVRMLRFVRVVRALRVMRTLGLFQSLRVLVNTIYMSLSSLFWSMLVLFVFMLSTALFLCQMLQEFIRDDQENYNTRVWVNRHYGTSSKALYTVFELTLSGCWPNYVRTLIEEVNPGYAAFFSLYVTGVVFAMIRIISALFLKDTLTSTANDDELLCSERTKEINAFKAKLTALFNEADKSDDGFLDEKELEWLLEHPNVKVWMSALGLDVRSGVELFELLDDGDGLVSQFEFLDGITRLRGSARSQDLFILMRSINNIQEQCDLLCDAMHSTMGVPGRLKRRTRGAPTPKRSGSLTLPEGPHRIATPDHAGFQHLATSDICAGV